MNKQCIKCNHIMLVPDIPLPAGYTQKCIACGHLNDVSDSYNPITDPEDDAFSSSVDPSDIIDFSHSTSRDINQASSEFSIESTPIDHISLEKKLTNEFDAKIKALQAQIDRLNSNSHPLSPEMAQATIPKKNNNPLLESPVAENEALFYSEQIGMAKLCANKLRQKNIQTHVVSQIDEAIKQVSEHAYQIIIVDHRMLQGKPGGVTFLKTLNAITLPVRRQQVVALLTPGIETGESQVFYQWGMDVNIHFDDLDVLVDIILDTIELKKDLYNEYSGIQIPE